MESWLAWWEAAQSPIPGPHPPAECLGLRQGVAVFATGKRMWKVLPGSLSLS